MHFLSSVSNLLQEGVWRYAVRNQKHDHRTVQVYVKSSPRIPGAETVTVKVKTSSSNLNASGMSVFPVDDQFNTFFMKNCSRKFVVI